MRYGRPTGIIVVLLTLGLWPADATACKCLTGAEACHSIGEAEAIFEATVASIETQSLPLPDSTVMHSERVVHLRDIRAWRGDAAHTVVTGMGGGDCGYSFQVGVRYVIVGHRNQGDGRIKTGICAMTRPLAQARAMRDYVESLASPSRGGRVWGTVSTQKPWASSGADPPPEPKPVANVRVTLTGPNERTMTTGPDGQFSFDVLPPGEYVVGAELPDGRGAGSTRPRSTTLDGPYACAVLDLLAPNPTRVVGTVVHEDGTAAAGVSVDLVAAEADHTDAFLGLGATADRNGRYTIPSVPPGRYLVGVGAIGGPSRAEPFALAYGRSDQGNLVITVAEDDDAVPVAPIVTRRLAPVRVHGTVLRSDLAPALGVEVTAAAVGERGPVRGLVRGETASDGRFTLEVFAETLYRITFSRRGRVIHSVDIVATDEPLLVTLPVQ